MSSPVLPLQSWKRQLPESVTLIGWICLVAGVVVCVGAYLIDPRRSSFNTIVLYLFLASVAGGSIFLVALEYVAGAVWSVPFRRVNEFLSALAPIVPLLAIPVLFNMHDVFHWAQPGAVAADRLLSEKQPYLNVPFFIVRFLIVSLLWGLVAFLFTRNSVKQDLSRDQNLTKRNAILGAIFMPLFAVSLTVLAIDWAMSIEPHWYSTIFGVYFFSGTVLAGVATATLIVVLLHEGGYLPPLRPDHLYSLGALLFAFVNFWAYIAFSQFLLIWYANLPEETFWFIKRWTHGWQYVSVLLIVMQFAVPYFALLAQDAKMNPKRLKVMAIWILVAHFLDVYWLVMPSFDGSVPCSWIEIGYPVLGAGLVIVVVSLRMKKHNLIPVGDPKLERGLNFRL
jgi:hypothetical protein